MTRLPRLLVFAPYYLPHVGGLELFAHDLHNELLRDGVVERVTILAPRLPFDAAPLEVEFSSARIIRYDATELVFNFPVPMFWRSSFWRAMRRARADGPTVVVCHTRFFIASVMAWAVARRHALPFVHVEHGADFVQANRRVVKYAAKAYDYTLGRFVLRHADRVIAISPATADFIGRLSGRRATVIRRGFRLNENNAVAPVPRSPGTRIAMSAGRLIEGKGLEDLIAAIRIANRKGLVCVLLGEGEERARIEARHGDLIARGVLRLVGQVSNSEVIAQLNEADVLVQPSYTEGLGATVAEAAMSGCPIIATGVGGIVEIVKDRRTGLLVPPRDPERLAKAIIEMLDNVSLRERVAEGARELMHRDFSWDVSATQWANAFSGIEKI